MKNALFKFGLISTIVFLCFFVYFYRQSGKFNRSIITAFIAVSVFLSSQQPAHSAGEADAFTQQQQQHQSRPEKVKGLFGRNSNNNGSGPEKPNGDGDGDDDFNISKFPPQPEPVSVTEERVEQMKNLVCEMKDIGDSDTDSEDESVEQPEVNQHTSLDAMSNSLDPEYSEYQKDHPPTLPPRFETSDCSFSKFKQLAYDPTFNGYTRVSIDEARAVVQAELQNLVIEPTRPNKLEATQVDLDFKVQGPHPWTHVDIKQPIGSEALVKQNQTISVEDMGYNIGQKIVTQKQKFVGRENGPVSSENVGHIVDLCYLPSSEKAIVKQNILKGARDNGSDAGIIFLNDI